MTEYRRRAGGIFSVITIEQSEEIKGDEYVVA